VDQHRRNARPARSHGVALDRSEAAGDELDGATLAKMFRAEAAAAKAIQKSPSARALSDRGGRRPARPEGSQLSRILNARPSHTPASASTTPTSGRWDGGWSRRAPPTKTRWQPRLQCRPGARRKKKKACDHPVGRPFFMRFVEFRCSRYECRRLQNPKPRGESQKQQRGGSGIGPDTIHASR